MATSSGKHFAEPQARGERITVVLIPVARDDLQRLQERTSLSKTDLENRAIISYEFFDAQLRASRELIVRNNKTGEAQRIQLL